MFSHESVCPQGLEADPPGWIDLPLEGCTPQIDTPTRIDAPAPKDGCTSQDGSIPPSQETNGQQTGRILLEHILVRYVTSQLFISLVRLSNYSKRPCIEVMLA